MSNWNRGYIFLVSLLKASYLLVTCAYCLQFCAVYPVSIIQVWWDLRDQEWLTYMLMVLFVFLFCLVAYLLQRKKTQVNSMVKPAKLLFWTFVLNFSAFVLLLIPFSST